MAKEYQGFPISNFRTGFDEALEPWLLPRDAFQVLNNAHLYRGVVEKIGGYNKISNMSYRDTVQMTGLIDGVNQTFTTVLPYVPTTANTVIQAKLGGGPGIREIFTDNGNGVLTSTGGGSGTINYIANVPVAAQPAGYVTVTFNTPPSNLTHSGIQYNTVILFYDRESDALPGDTDIMGIKPYMDNNGSQDVLVFNTRRVGKLVTLTGEMSVLQQLDYGITELPHEIQELGITTGFNGSTQVVTGTVTAGLVPGSVSFQLFDSSAETATLIDTITDSGAGRLESVLFSGSNSYINYSTGEWRMEFAVARPATDTMLFSGCVQGDTFTGDFSDFFSVVNYQGNAFITNNIDQPRYYEGSCVKFLNTNTSAKPNTVAPYDITRVLHLSLQRERLLLVSIYFQGAPQLNNIFWSTAGSPLNFTNNEFLPATTSQKIVAISDINTDLIVRFSNSERVFRYTQDAFSPFRWDSTNSLWRCDANFSAINYDSWFSSIGSDAIVSSDGVNVTRADEIIPDFTLNLRIDEQMPVPSISQSSIGQCYGERFDEFKEGWLCYKAYDKSGGIQRADNVLAFNYLDGTYAIYKFPFSVLGYGRITASDTWGNNYYDWGDSLDTWGSYSQSIGALISLGGDHAGNVYKLGEGSQITDMEGIPINCLFEVITKDFNPFVEEGQLARFGYVDFLVSANENTKFRVQFYLNNKITPTFNTFYQETILSLPGDGQSKIWKRIYVGSVGKIHTMRIYQAEEDFDDGKVNQPLRIHAMVPYFKPAGRIFS